ncbi:MAG: hypothetical protein KKH80_02040 [Candidatus Omnitrophica bacterium]|nr:hypothetical protein [Candidatus Omnitrophota bacterium]
MTNQRLSKAVFSVICCLLIVALAGCESFTRKFTRKSKKSDIKEEVVLIPEEYSPSDIPVEERYRQSLAFWKSWQDELIANLEDPLGSYKKRNSCIEEAIKNLENLRPFLFEEKQKDLDAYLAQLRLLQSEMKRDTYASNLSIHSHKAETLKRNIFRDFSYSNIKAHLR